MDFKKNDYEELGKTMERMFMQSGVGRSIIAQKVSDIVGMKDRQIEQLTKTAEKYDEAVRILDDVAKRLRITPQNKFDSCYPAGLGILVQSALDLLATPIGAPAKRTLVIASNYERRDIHIYQVTKKSKQEWTCYFYDENGEDGDEKSFLIGDDPNRYGTNKFLLACKEYLGLEDEYVSNLDWNDLEKIVQQLFDKLTDDPCVSLERYCEVLTEFIRQNDTTWEWIVV